MKAFFNKLWKSYIDWVKAPFREQMLFFIRFNIAAWSALASGILVATGSVFFFPEQTDAIIFNTKIIMSPVMIATAYFIWKWSVRVNYMFGRKNEQRTKE
jgi:hypothetical protein